MQPLPSRSDSPWGLRNPKPFLTLGDVGQEGQGTRACHHSTQEAEASLNYTVRLCLSTKQEVQLPRPWQLLGDGVGQCPDPWVCRQSLSLWLRVSPYRPPACPSPARHSSGEQVQLANWLAQKWLASGIFFGPQEPGRQFLSR